MDNFRGLNLQRFQLIRAQNQSSLPVPMLAYQAIRHFKGQRARHQMSRITKLASSSCSHPVQHFLLQIAMKVKELPFPCERTLLANVGFGLQHLITFYAADLFCERLSDSATKSQRNSVFLCHFVCFIVSNVSHSIFCLSNANHQSLSWVSHRTA